MRKFVEKSGILVRVLTATIPALVLDSIKIGDTRLAPQGIRRIFVAFPTLFNQFLSLVIPPTIIGLVAPVVAGLGRDAGKRLGMTATITYDSTLFSGLLTYLTYTMVSPKVLQGGLADVAEPGSALETYLTVETSATVLIMTALLLSFIVGIGLAMVPRNALRKGFVEFRAIITKPIEHIIIPLLPPHIFGIFPNFTYTGEAWTAMHTPVQVVIVVLIPEAVILLSQYLIAGVIGKKSPIKPPLAMISAYLTVLGTFSSAAMIPVTLHQTRKNDVSNPVASLTVPLCTTIHLAGSASKIFAFVFAIAFTQGVDVTPVQWVGFVFVLDITMVAAPDVSGGAIMAATGLLFSMLGFNDTQVALTIAAYIALDSFGTATNVTGDGMIAVIVDYFVDDRISAEGDLKNTRRLSFDGMKYLDKVPVEGPVSAEEPKASATQAGENVVSN